MSADSKQGWRVVACLCVTALVIWGGALSFGVFVRPLIETFHWSHTRVALLFTALMFSMGIADPAAGWLLEKIEGNLVIIAGALLALVALLAASRAESFTPLFLAYLAYGVGLAFSTIPPGHAIAPHWFEKQRGLALGLIAAASALGAVVMPMVAELGEWAYGWRGAYVALAAPIVLILPWIYTTVRTRPPEAVKEAQSPARLVPGMEMGEALRTSGLWLIMIGYLGWGIMISTPLAHLIAYLREIGYSPLRATLAFSAMQFLSVPGCVVLGILSDRLEGRSVCAVSLLLSSVGLVILPQAGNVGALGLFVLLFGISFVAPVALLPLLLSRLVGLKRYRLFAGVALLAMNFGSAFAPPLAGKIIDATGSYTPVYQLVAAVTFFVALLVMAVPRSRVLAVAPSPSVGSG